MMGLATIHRMNDEIARRARQTGKKPVLFEGQPLSDLRIPNIGDYRPRGYKLIETYFVDKTGWGTAGEPALTIEQFYGKLTPGRYYAMIEEGQMQCYVGEFER